MLDSHMLETKASQPLEKVVEQLLQKINDIPIGDPLFADPQYIPKKLDVANFHPISDEAEAHTLAFVDGGNSTIVQAPNFVLDLTRIYFGKYRSGRRLNARDLPQRIEFYTLCYTKSKNGELVYATELIPLREEWIRFLPDTSDLTFTSLDRTLMMGLQRATLDTVARTVRVFAEWKLAGLIAERELDKGDVLVRDGSLQTFVTNERKYANEAYEKAMKLGVVFSALAKTSTLFTSTGWPLITAIHELSQSSTCQSAAWYYHPIVAISHPNHRAEMYAVKLQPDAEYIFRFELLREQARTLNQEMKAQVLSTVAQNARDISFPGYPYGLIDADHFGRVSDEEKEVHAIRFMATVSAHGAWPKLRKCITALDAHQRMDALRGA